MWYSNATKLVITEPHKTRDAVQAASGRGYIKITIMF